MLTRMHVRSPRTLALAALAAAALAVAGCGSSGSTVDPVAQAADATSKAGGAQMTFTGDFAMAGVNMKMTGSGFFNYRSGEGNLSFQMSGLPQLGSRTLAMTELMKSSTVYVGSDLFAGKLPGGARWLKLDLGRFVSAMGMSPEQLTGGQSNPAQYLQYLKASGGTVKIVGHERVRGVPTTHYSGSVDLAKAADRLPSADRGKLRQAMSKLISQTGSRSLPVEVWIDDRHLVRRMTMRMPLAASAGTGGVTIAIELFGFGPTPTVKAPPAGDVFDGTGAALRGLSAAGG